jgi:hypothetical protein
MGNFYRDNDELQYYLEKGIDWEPLVRLTEFDFEHDDGFDSVDDAVDFYKSVAEMVGRFVSEEVEPHAQEIDREGLELVDGEVEFPDELDQIFEEIKPLELHGLCIPRELGGMNCPILLYMLMTEMFGRADVSISAHHGFHGGMAMALLAYSIEEGTTEFDDEGRIESTRFQQEIEEIISGEAWGSDEGRARPGPVRIGAPRTAGAPRRGETEGPQDDAAGQVSGRREGRRDGPAVCPDPRGCRLHQRIRGREAAP